MKLLHKNSLSGVGQLALTAGLTFFSIPVFIRALGDEAYGAFSIVTLAGNLNIFANLGLNTALLKFLSSQGKSKESDYDIAVTLGLLLIIMVPLSVLAITFQGNILQGMLGLSDKLYIQISSLYRCVVIANLIILLGQTFTTVLDSQQRIYITNFYQLIYSVMYWGGIITVVSLGYDMNALGVVILGSAVIWLGLVTIAAWRVWGGLELSGLMPELRRTASKQLSFGANVYTAGLLTMLFEPMTKIMVSRLIGVAEVGYLEIAYKIRSQIWALVTKFTYPLFPKIAQQTDTKQLSKMISNYQTIMLLLMLPLLLFIALTIHDIISIWLPNANSIIGTSTLCISITFVINSLSLPTYYFLASREYVQKTVLIQLTNVGVSLLIGLLTYRILGVYGFVLGNSIAILSSLLVCLYYQRIYLGFWQLDLSQFRTLLSVLIPLGILSVLSNFYVTDRWIRVGVISLFTVISYFLFIHRSYKSLQALSA